MYLLLQAFRQSLIRQRQQDKHGPVFLYDRQEFFKFLCLQRNGIHQRPAGIMAKRRLQHIHMAGIYGQGQMGHAADLLQGSQHSLFLVNAAHAHVHVQNPRAAALLLLRKLRHLVKNSVPQLRLQQLLARRIDSLTHYEEIIVQPEAFRPAFRGQAPDSLFPVFSLGYRACPNAVMKPFYMLRRCPAAAPQNGGSRLSQQRHLLRELFRVHIIIGFSVCVQKRQACIGLCNNGNPCAAGHIGYDLLHCGRPRGTVCPDGSSPKGLQHNGRSPGIRPVKRPAIRLKGHGHHHRQIADLFRCNHRGPGLCQTHHGLHHKQICPGVPKRYDLLLIDLNQLLQRHLPNGRKLPPCHCQVPRHIHRPVRLRGRLPGNSCQFLYHLHKTPLQPIVRQLDPVGRKGGHIQDIRAGSHILLLEL